MQLKQAAIKLLIVQNAAKLSSWLGTYKYMLESIRKTGLTSVGRVYQPLKIRQHLGDTRSFIWRIRKRMFAQYVTYNTLYAHKKSHSNERPLNVLNVTKTLNGKVVLTPI